MNSKFTKNSKKVQKNWIYLASKRLECTRCLQVLVIKWRTRRSREKKQNSAFFQSFFELKFVFFSTSSYDVQTQQKCAHILRTWVSSVPQNFIFFDFFFYFFEFTIHMRTKFMFSFATSSQGVRTAWKFVHTLQTWVSSIPQSFNFVWFFCYFFRTVKDLWPDGNGREGHFYKWN